jgi:hypothetical protein
VGGREPSDKNKIADLAMTAERRRGCKDHIVADLTIVTDMAAVHEVTAVADAGDAPARHGPGAHGGLFADDATLADLKPGEFAATAQRLRRGAERNEWIDRAAVADGGPPLDIHMRDQPAVGADNDIWPHHAVRTDRSSLADHGAILNSRGGVDHHPTHPPEERCVPRPAGKRKPKSVFSDPVAP